MGIHRVNLRLLRPFRSLVRSRHAKDSQTDRQTDGQTPRIMPPPMEVGTEKVQKYHTTALSIKQSTVQCQTGYSETSIIIGRLVAAWLRVSG